MGQWGHGPGVGDRQDSLTGMEAGEETEARGRRGLSRKGQDRASEQVLSSPR